MKFRNHDTDRGATAILIAFSMVVLLGFVAVTIDAAGFGFNERRQAQSAADVGALAAVQFAQPVDRGHPECGGLSGLALSRCNGAVEARNVANATLDDPSLANWTDSSRCSTTPVGYTTVPAVSACIAFNANNQRAWVRIPTMDIPTSIAQVIGFNAVSVSANAIAGTEFAAAGGGVMPFMMPGGSAAADYNCLKSGPNPNFGSCSEVFPEVGNFGWADFYMYGDETLGYSRECSGGTQNRLVANIARGVDHPLGLHPTGIGSVIHERSSCPDFNAEPDGFDSQPGSGTALEQGILYGGSYYATSSYPGRIQDPGGYLVRNSGGPTSAALVDNTPLWDYLLTSLPGPCSGVTTPSDMEACISWAKTTQTVIFNDDLVTAKRYGWVPQVWESAFTGSPYHINMFRPVYLDTTWFACSNNDCTIMHTPGVVDSGAACPSNPPDARITCGTPGTHNRNLEAVTAYILHPDIVPDNAKTPFPGAENQRTFRLIE